MWSIEDHGWSRSKRNESWNCCYNNGTFCLALNNRCNISLGSLHQVRSYSTCSYDLLVGLVQWHLRNSLPLFISCFTVAFYFCWWHEDGAWCICGGCYVRNNWAYALLIRSHCFDANVRRCRHWIRLLVWLKSLVLFLASFLWCS